MSDTKSGVLEGIRRLLDELQSKATRLNAESHRHLLQWRKAEAEVTRLRRVLDRGESETYAGFQEVQEILKKHNIEIDTKCMGTGDVERAVERLAKEHGIQAETIREAHRVLDDHGARAGRGLHAAETG